MKHTRINAATMGQMNRNMIFKLIQKTPSITRREISKLTGLDPSTVTRITTKLMDEGFVKEEGEKVTNQPGRKGISLFPIKDAAVSIVIKIGIENTIFGLGYLDKTLEIIEEIPTIRQSDMFLTVCVEKLNDILNKYSKDKNIIGISFSIPGIVEPNEGKIITAPHLNWNDVKLKSTIEENIERKDLFIIMTNEARLSLLSEIFFNRLVKNLQSIVYIFISQGVGGALYLNGKIYEGATNSSGEIGHMTISETGALCHCGNRGCWETFVSIDSVVTSYELSNNSLSGSNYKEKYANLLKRTEQNDINAKKILNIMVHNLAIGISNVVNIINPHAIVIGGIGEKIPENYIDQLQVEVQHSSLAFAGKQIKIMKAKIDIDRACLYGCTITAMEKFTDIVTI
ncbi:MAG: hypothetical protein PWQ77_506 [Kosmotogales bacterium]|nr:hypothetical protein [Kosmotogales bacterium]